ncbi:MAG TPA: hypothetical protein VKF32_15690, partial [Thermoanaerobaculia bacterium]|nr:hypothetical protein [Thermoanaerobaculia bacterium]
AGVVVDAAGNVYVSDTANNRVRRVDASTGLIDTFAGGGNPSDNVGDGGPATAANVAQPWGLALDGKGNLFIAENNGSRVRKVNLASRLISTVAGNGTAGSSGDGGSATSAQLAGPLSVAADPAGNLFIADAANDRIRRVDAQSGAIETFAGNGTHDFADDVPATQTGLFFPDVVALDAAGANLYILDTFHGRVRRVAVASRVITTVAGGGSGGDGGQAKDASIGYYPFGLAVEAAGNVYVADGRVRKITAATGVIDTIAGGGTYVGDGGPAKQALLRYPQGLAIDPKSGDLLIVDSFAWRVRDVSKDARTISTRVGDGSYGTLAYPVDAAVDAAGNVYVALANGSIVVRKDAQSGALTTFAGGGSPVDGVGDGGPATDARFDDVRGVAVDAAGNVYVCESGGNRVRRVDAVSHAITRLAGTGKGAGVYAGGDFSGEGGDATKADLNGPIGAAVDDAGNVFFADSLNQRIRRVDKATGVITTFAGSGPAGSGSGDYGGDGGVATAARLYNPARIAFDASGNLFVADSGNHRIRRVDKTTRIITTVAGSGQADYGGEGGLATASALNSPLGVAVDSAGNLYFSDAGNNLVRVVPTSGCALPVISAQPRSQTIVNGFAAVLSVTASGSGALTYQWFRGVAGDAANAIPGATSPSFTTPALSATTSYWVRVRNDCGPVDSATATITVTSLLADLALALEASPEPVPVGGRLTYALTARDNGPTAATDVVLADTLPAGVTLVSASASQGSCSGSAPVTCALGTIVQGAEAKVTIVVTPAAAGVLTNRARVSGSEPDPDEANNSALAVSTVSPATSADLAVFASASPDPVRTGSPLTVTLFVQNNGPAGATNVAATATLPSGTALVSASALLGTCSGNGPVTCALGSLAAGASTTVTLVVQPSTVGTLRTDATLAGAQADANPANNAASASVAVLSSTAACPAPAPQILASPSGVVRAGDSFTVSWSDVYGPTDPNGTYRVQLAGASDFAAASLLVDLTGRNLSASFPTAPGAAATLFLRVAALAGCGTPGAFSETVAINVAPNPPSILFTQAQSPEWVVPLGQLPPAATLKVKNVGGAATP